MTSRAGVTDVIHSDSADSITFLISNYSFIFWLVKVIVSAICTKLISFILEYITHWVRLKWMLLILIFNVVFNVMNCPLIFQIRKWAKFRYQFHFCNHPTKFSQLKFSWNVFFTGRVSAAVVVHWRMRPVSQWEGGCCRHLSVCRKRWQWEGLCSLALMSYQILLSAKLIDPRVGFSRVTKSELYKKYLSSSPRGEDEWPERGWKERTVDWFKVQWW